MDYSFRIEGYLTKKDIKLIIVLSLIASTLEISIRFNKIINKDTITKLINKYLFNENKYILIHSYFFYKITIMK